LENKEAYSTIEMQNENIKSSIVYAQTIQNALLPTSDTLNKYLHVFTIFLPKDIVSGDFYWYTQINNQLFLAVADCTGHGVPGAFMSMIGIQMLNRIIIEKQISDPGLILDTLNYEWMKILNQDTSDNNDGMDLVIARFNLSDNMVTNITFSGAKNPFYFCKYSDKTFTRYKTNSRTIAGKTYKSTNENFTNYNLELHKGDTIYIITDGIIDLANDKREKFGSPKLISLLNSLINKPLSFQESEISKTIENFCGTTPLRDDITILGIQI